MPKEELDHIYASQKVFNAIVEISEGTGIFTNGAVPKTAPPKAEISRKPPGASIAPTKSAAEKH